MTNRIMMTALVGFAALGYAAGAVPSVQAAPLVKQDTKAQDDMANRTDQKTAQEVTDRAAPAARVGESNEKFGQPKRIEDGYPLTDEAARQKTAKTLQQLTVDLLTLFNQYKESHWNVNGPLYLPLHEYYQEQADFYRGQADVFAERVLHLG